MYNSICNLFIDREKQLNTQETLDRLLLENFDKCPLTVFQLLLLERQQNRDQLKSNKGDFLTLTTKIPSMIKNTRINLDKIDEYQQDLTNVLKSSESTVCSNLQKFINEHG